MISEFHQAHLPLKYGLDPADERVQAIVSSITQDEAQRLLHRGDLRSGGLLVRYPGSDAFTIRLDDPVQLGDKQAKYLRRAGEPNVVFNPGVDLDKAQEIWFTEGELKALAGFTRGLPILGLSGIWNWRTQTEDTGPVHEGERIPDDQVLLPELRRSWKEKQIVLVYDSDIVPGHQAYDTFPRLAEQLYALGAERVEIITLPGILSDGKTGLDDFLIEKGDKGPELLVEIINKAGMYIPFRDGAEAFIESLIARGDDVSLLWAAGCLLESKSEYLARTRLKAIPDLKAKDIDLIIKDAKAEVVPQLTIKSGPAITIEPQVDHPGVSEARGRMSDLRYTINNFGEICIRQEVVVCGESVEKVIPLCNFTAWPTREIVKDDGVQQARFIEVAGVNKDGYEFTPTTVPATDFDSMKWVLANWGGRANIEPFKEKHLRHAILSMVDPDQPDSVVFTHLGWRKIEDTWVYLHAGGAVGSSYVDVEISSRLAGYTLPKDDGGVDVAETLKASLGLLQVGKEEITYPLLALVYLAPLCDVLTKAGREPGFAPFMLGPTASFKSTTAALFLSHYGAFHAKGLPASFRDTAFSAEVVAFIAKDVLLVVDDLYPPQSKKEKDRLNSTLEYLTRSQGDRTGRGRLQPSRELQTGNPPRGLVLCTGEEMALPPGSSYYRLLLLPLADGDIDEELLTEAQADANILPYAMKAYLEFLAPQLDDAPYHLQGLFDSFRAKAAERSTVEDKHRRLDEVVAHLAVGFASMARFATAQGVWTEAEAAAETEKAFEIYVWITDLQAAGASKNDPVTRFFNGLQELLASDKVFFASMDDGKSEDVPPSAEKVGWGPDDGGMIYLLFNAALKSVKNLYNGTDEPLVVTTNTLLDLMEARGLITRNNDDERVVQKWIGGKNRRILPILGTSISGGAGDE